MSLPHVIYIGEHQIASHVSTGVTLAELYDDYPPGAITQFTTPRPGAPIVGKMVSVPTSVAPFATPFASAARFYLRHRRRDAPTLTIPHNAIQQSSPTLKTQLLANMAAATDISPVRIERETLESLAAGGPQVIHAVIGRIRTLRLTLAVSRRLDLPILPHFTDDWISTIYTSGELGSFARRVSLRLVDELLERSPALLVIGEAMANEYESRFDKRCYVASAGIDPTEFRTRYNPGSDPKRLVYVGNPLIGRAQIADVIGEHAKTRGWEVVVYPMLPERWGEMTKHVRIENQLPPSEVPPVLQQADALLFPESFEPETAAYTRLSFSTKAAQLIAAGRPILAVGPRGQGSINEIGSHSSRSFVLESLDSHELSRAFDYLSANLTSQNVPVPEKYFSSSMRRSFHDALRLGADA